MTSITAKIYELSGPKELHLKEETIVFDQVRPDHFVARTLYSAISPGTETAAFRGAEPLRPGNIYPRVLGYCNVAEVVFAGVEVTTVAVGDLVLTQQSHRSAFSSRESDFHIRLAAGTDLRHATTAYLYHLGYHSLLTSGCTAGHHAGIIGLGVLGYTSAVLAKIAGLNVVAFSDQPASSIPELSGYAIPVFSKQATHETAIADLTGGTGLDVMINTSNSWEDWRLALLYANKGGQIVNLGFPGRDQPPPPFNPLDPAYVYTKNLTIKALSPLDETGGPHYISRFSLQRNMRYILGLIGNGAIRSEEIIETEASCLDLGEQYEIYLSKKRKLTTLLNWKACD